MKVRFSSGAILLALLLALLSPVCAESSETLFVERQVYQYLTQELNMNSAAACGVLANIEHESAFNLSALGDGGTSYGLCQWHNGRYSALINFCNSQGLDYQSIDGQMRYLALELKTGYFSLLATLRHVDNSPEGAYRAAYIWCTQFERPANAEYQAATRAATAQFKYWNRYNATTVSSIVIPAAPTDNLAGYMLEELHNMDYEAPVSEETSLPPITQMVPESDPILPEVQESTTLEKPAQKADIQSTRRVPKKQFPVRQRLPLQAASDPQPDYYTGIAIGLGLMPMGEYHKRWLVLPVPEKILAFQ